MTRPRLIALAMVLTALALTAATACKAGSQQDARHREQRSASRTDPPTPRRVTSGTAWNPAQIRWRGYADGLARAKSEHKPVCLVLFATWCPHCKHYSHVFDDPRVVAEAKKFVMIRVDTDRERDVASRYKLDGDYVPRTYFLTPEGKVAGGVHARRTRYIYFYSEYEPASLLGGMQRAEKLAD